MDQVQYPNDRVDISGKEHPTVGENIRNGSKKLTFKSQSERSSAYTALMMTPATLKFFMINMLTGKTGVWGGTATEGFNESDKQNIKNWLDS